MKIHTSINVDRVMDAAESGENAGFCISCGADADGCEPDAREYACVECGRQAVYGAEEIVISFM